MKELLREKEMKEAKRKQEEGKSTWDKVTGVFRESDEVEVDLDELSINEELETDIEPHCGKKKKHKEVSDGAAGQKTISAAKVDASGNLYFPKLALQSCTLAPSNLF